MQKLAKVSLLSIAILGLVSLSLNGLPAANAESNDPLQFPVLLVHGLGEGPGAATFGALQENLEKFYWKVEVMDFNKYKKGSLAKGNDAGELGNLAQVLGQKVKEMRKKYDVAKINVVAHSYGGLIVHAYVAGLGDDYGKKGDYDNDIYRVVYLQTPFYGVDPEYSVKALKKFAATTDYGPFTDEKEMVNVLTEGSSVLYDIDTLLRFKNVYESDIKAMCLMSEDDTLVPVTLANISQFTDSGDWEYWRTMKGYDHDVTGETGASGKTLAWVDEITDENFIAIASFLDEGERWSTVGDDNLASELMLMMKYDIKKGFKAPALGDITLKLKKKEKAGKGSEIKVGQVIQGTFNKTSKVFVFKNLPFGTYEVTAKANGKVALTDDISFSGERISNFAYDPEINLFREGDEELSDFDKLPGIYKLKSFTFQTQDKTELEADFTGLNYNNFVIEFKTKGCDQKYFDKGSIFMLVNKNGAGIGSDQRINGARLEYAMRGTHVPEPYLPKHAGKVTAFFVADKDRDGYRDFEAGEGEEQKSESTYDWMAEHFIKIVVKTDESGIGHCRVYVDNIEVVHIEKSKGYYNPAPRVVLGGYLHNEDYHSPKGGTIYELRIYNGS